MRTLAEAAAGGEEWAAVYRAMLRQAEVDAAAFEGELAAREATFAEQLGSLRDAAVARVAAARDASDTAQRRARRLRKAAAQAARDHAVAMERIAAAVTEGIAAQTARQEQEVALAAARRAILHRLDRLALIDAQRERLNALGAAFEARRQRRIAATSAHAFAAAVLALGVALEEGLPLEGPLALVGRAAAGEDALAAAATAAVPEVAKSKGALPRPLLAARLEAAAPRAAALALVPQEGAGVLARALALAASAARVEEPPAGAAALPGGGVEAALARARAALADNELSLAADALEVGAAGSEAAKELAPVADALRARAAAEQAHAALAARAAELVAAATVS